MYFFGDNETLTIGSGLHRKTLYVHNLIFNHVNINYIYVTEEEVYRTKGCEKAVSRV